MSTEHDEPMDDSMDARLRAAGARWRAAHDAAAAPDFVALTATPSGAVDEEPVDVSVSPAGRTGRRHRWLISGLSAAATVVAVVVALAIVRPGSGNDGGPTATATAGLAGIDWTLTSYSLVVDDAPLRSLDGVTLAFTGGEVKGNDGCNHFFGPVSVAGSDTLTFGAIASTAMACPDREDLGSVIHSVLTGTVHYELAGDTLTITKDGVGTLVYRGEQQPGPVTDPAVLAGTTWTLNTIIDGAGPDGTASNSPDYARVMLTFDANAGISGNDSCNEFSGRSATESGAMRISDVVGTTRPCPSNATPQRVRSVLTGDVTWSITGDKLTITKNGVGSLIYVKQADNAQDRPLVDPESLRGTQWQLEAIASDDVSRTPEWSAADLATVTLAFDNTFRASGFDGCNAFAGVVKGGGATMVFDEVAFTERACPGSLHDTVRTVLSGTVNWSVSAGNLTVTNHVTTLTFVNKAVSGN